MERLIDLGYVECTLVVDGFLPEPKIAAESLIVADSRREVPPHKLPKACVVHVVSFDIVEANAVCKKALIGHEYVVQKRAAPPFEELEAVRVIPPVRLHLYGPNHRSALLLGDAGELDAFVEKWPPFSRKT